MKDRWRYSCDKSESGHSLAVTYSWRPWGKRRYLRCQEDECDLRVAEPRICVSLTRIRVTFDGHPERVVIGIVVIACLCWIGMIVSSVWHL